MKYTIAYDRPNTQYVPIKATIEVGEQNTVELQFPVWRPGRYERADFAKNIHSFSVLNDRGKKIEAKKTRKDRWSVDCSDTSSIEVNYRYFAAVLNAGATFVDDLQLYVNPVNCLLYCEAQQHLPCELELLLPDNFQVACGHPFQHNRAVFDDYHQLVDSPFIASPSLQHRTFAVEGTRFHLWFQGEIDLDERDFLRDVERYTISQIEQFGQFPVEEYHYLYQILPVRAYHGVEHQTSTVIALGPSYEVMGERYDDFLGVSAHELYHTWNVKALRPAELLPYDYATENYSHQGYVTEGVTTYMGDLCLVESGVKEWEWYRQVLEKLLNRHFANFGRFNHSVAESSFDTWLDGYTPGVPDRKVSIYNEGALLALVVDVNIRTNSDNRHSLHDVMADLYTAFARAGKGYTAADFQQTVARYADGTVDQLFARYYYGTDGFETVLAPAFERLGLRLALEKNPAMATRILGIQCAVEGGNTLVKKIHPGGTADLAGVMLEDEVIAVNGFRICQNIDQWVGYFQDRTLELTLHRKGRLLSVVCPHTNKNYFPLYLLQKATHPSKLQKRTFGKWCGCDWDAI